MNAALVFMSSFLAVSTNKYQSDFRTKSLYVARLVIKKGGCIHSRVDLKNRRHLIEKWQDGTRIWVHPDQSIILANHTFQLSTEFTIGPEEIDYLAIDDRMPN